MPKAEVINEPVGISGSATELQPKKLNIYDGNDRLQLQCGRPSPNGPHVRCVNQRGLNERHRTSDEAAK